MEPTAVKIKMQLDKIWSFLQPMLPMANCHMVEFYTGNHWEKYIPKLLQIQLEKLSLDDAVGRFWNAANDWKDADNKCELRKFVSHARSNCLDVDNEICFTVDEFKRRLQMWGGCIPDEVEIKEFMSPKKAYEVRTMSPLVCALSMTSHATHCVDAGGGRGSLAAAVAAHGGGGSGGGGGGGGGVKALVLDADPGALSGGLYRDRILQKKKGKKNNMGTGEWSVVSHRYVHANLTVDTDIRELVHKKFPEDSQNDVRILLTGLHTCGDLGTTSVRQFVSRPALCALFTVPCCYHLLEDTRLADHCRTIGMNLGRNARMLAAQSVDRVTALRQLPAVSLHYRAVLQVLIKENLSTDVVAEGKLKRLHKCQTFAEYFRAADAILKLGLGDKVSDSFLIELNEKYDRKKLIIFYLLRMCLAQVVESIILLDRLLFLYENRYKYVFLVKIFDPILSPRCHAIVALK